MKEYRYEVIAWDGCGHWGTSEALNRKEARKWKRFLLHWAPKVLSVKIYDRKLKKFIY